MIASYLGFYRISGNILIKQSIYNIQKNILLNLINQQIRYFAYAKGMDKDLKIRSNPIVTKLDSPEFHSIFSNNLNDLLELFKKYNFEIRIAGGAVRDLVLGIKPVDLDFATTATPMQMKEMFIQENIRMINQTGEKHGTITPRINDSENFEITTLRIDVETDGRHAEVEFTTDWQLDANRRDLTINSMFLGFDGSVYDYFYGYDDLLARRVAFVGNPNIRIKEDYLRILRYFRFYGRICDQPGCHEEIVLDAIKKNGEGLSKISGERVWVELKKILMGNYPDHLIETMLMCNIAKYIGLPESSNSTDLKNIFKNNANFMNEPLHPITLLCSLLRNVDDALALHDRLKLSAFERDLSIFITQNREESSTVCNILPFQKHIFLSIKRESTKQHVMELLKYLNQRKLYEEICEWNVPKFPLIGTTLKEHGCQGGNMIGNVMKKLKIIWADHEFALSEEDLLKYVPEILSSLDNKSSKILKKNKMK